MNKNKIKTNYYYASLLLDDYAGVISEDSASHLYIFQHIILKNTNKKLSDCLLRISIKEMQHLSILGDLIIQLGGIPFFKTYSHINKKIIPWNADFINYELDEIKILELNIESEKNAILQYKKHISLIHDVHIKETLEKIILDEEEHIKIFESFLLK
ncbi:MAG: ferritin family protein [bacterium]